MSSGMTLKLAESTMSYDKGLAELLGDIAINERMAVKNFLDTVKVNQLSELSILDLFECGFSREGSEKVLTTLQFALKLKQLEVPETFIVRSSLDAYQAVSYLQYSSQETFLAVALDTKNKVIAKKEIFVGTLNSCVVHPREVFRFAIRENAAGLIVAHQHPSGSPEESPEDVHMTRRLKEAGEVIGISLLDHIIVGSNGRFTSLQEKGFI